MIAALVNKIYNIDTIKFMKEELPNESVDLIIADPPYKIEAGGGQGGMRSGIFHRNKGGRQLFNYLTADTYMDEFKRIIKPSGHLYIYSNDKNLLDILHNAEKSGLKLMNVVVLNKGNKVAFGWFMKQVEFIVMFRNTKGNAKSVNNQSISNLIDVKFPKGKNRKHPSEKSVELAELLITQSSNDGETVFIPFAGSGSDIIACIKQKRNWIATELDNTYIEDIIKPRIEECS